MHCTVARGCAQLSVTCLILESWSLTEKNVQIFLYATRCHFEVRSKAAISQLNPLHGTKKVKSGKKN